MPTPLLVLNGCGYADVAPAAARVVGVGVGVGAVVLLLLLVMVVVVVVVVLLSLLLLSICAHAHTCIGGTCRFSVSRRHVPAMRYFSVPLFVNFFHCHVSS